MGLSLPHHTRFALAIFALWAMAAPAATWTIEPVSATGDLGRGIDLDLASTTLYAASWRTTGTLFLAGRTASAWTPLPAISMGEYDVAADHTGQIHVLIRRYESGQDLIELLHLAGGNWQAVPVASGTSLTACALAFDSQNHPHVAYIDHAGQALQHTFWTGSAWTTRTVFTHADFAYPYDAARIAIDSHDVAHFIWYNLLDLVRHSVWNGTAYVHRTVGGGYAQSMVFDSHDNLHISYVQSYSSLRYGRFDGSAWTTQYVGPTDDEGAIALDLLDRPHIVYRAFRYDAGARDYYDDLRHAAYNGSTWTIETITTWPDTATGPERETLVIDPRNRMHILFADDSRNLSYAHSDPGRQISLSPAFDAKATSSDGQSFVLTDGETIIGTQQYPAANVWRRGILEFNISTVPSHLRFASAALNLAISSYTSGSNGGPRLSTFGYAGNGTTDTADALNVTRSIGQSAYIATLGPISIPLDAGYLSSLLGQATHLGLVLFDPYSSRQAAFYASEAATFAVPPSLQLTCTRAADISGDAYVDMTDLLTLAAAWNTTRGQSLYDASCDINRDDAIDVTDLLCLADDFGT